MLDTPTPSGVRLELIWLELTGRCNLECVHCYADAGPGRPLDEGMQLRDWQRALSDAALLGCRRVQFIGGEPTLHPGLPTLIEQAHQLGFEQICVFTNGMHLSETHKELFRRYQVQLAVSVYGSRAEVHDSITQHRGSFAKTAFASTGYKICTPGRLPSASLSFFASALPLLACLRHVSSFSMRSHWAEMKRIFEQSWPACL